MISEHDDDNDGRFRVEHGCQYFKQRLLSNLMSTCFESLVCRHIGMVGTDNQQSKLQCFRAQARCVGSQSLTPCKFGLASACAAGTPTHCSSCLNNAASHVSTQAAAVTHSISRKHLKQKSLLCWCFLTVWAPPELVRVRGVLPQALIMGTPSAAVTQPKYFAV